MIKSFSYVRIFVDVLSTNGSLVENQDEYCFLKGIMGKIWILKVATEGKLLALSFCLEWRAFLTQVRKGRSEGYF